MPQNRILFVSLSNIGDAIMTTPVLQALHATYPDASIDIVADRRSSDVFFHCPYRGKIFHKDKHSILRGLPALVYELRSDRYDLVVDLRTDFAAYLLHAEKRLCRRHRKPYGPHSVEQHMGVIHELHGTNPIPSCVVWTGNSDKDFASQALQGYVGKKLLGMGPGANWPGKIWPQENFLGVIECLQQEFAAAVLLGSEKDRRQSEQIAARSALPCINLCGKTTLLQAAAVLQEASLFIGNDSGLGHMASGVNISTLTLFGVGQPERYRPWGARARWLAGAGQKIENISVVDVVSCLK